MAGVTRIVWRHHGTHTCALDECPAMERLQVVVGIAQWRQLVDHVCRVTRYS